MIVPTLTKIAIRHFEQKMTEFSENWDSDKWKTADSIQA